MDQRTMAGHTPQAAARRLQELRKRYNGDTTPPLRPNERYEMASLSQQLGTMNTVQVSELEWHPLDDDPELKTLDEIVALMMSKLLPHQRDRVAVYLHSRFVK